jgi:peptide/nickel transport system substrate-binding protein
MDKVLDAAGDSGLTGTSRRDLLKLAAAGAGGLLIPAGFSSAASAQPKKGGHMRWGISSGSTSSSRELALWLSFQQYVGLSAVNEYLVEIGADGKLIPRIAESWETPDKGKTWIFKLRKDVLFTNGKTLDAEDVVASWNYHKGSESKSTFKAFAELATPRALDANTVIFSSENPVVDLPFMTAYHMAAIMPAKDGRLLSTTSDISAGPYKLENFDPGVRVLLRKNENHWNDKVGHFESIELQTLIDVNARTNALLSGRIDAMDSVQLKTASFLRSNPKIRLLNTPSRGHVTFPMRTDMAPFDDVNVRLALKHAIDREGMLKRTASGFGVIANDQPISSDYSYYDPSLEQITYDPEKAKWHLKQAGLDNLSVDLRVSDNAWGGSSAVDGAILYQESAAKAGITINVARESHDGYWSHVWRKAPFCAGRASGFSTEDQQFSLIYASGVPYNDAFWSNEKCDRLIKEARAEFDVNKRKVLYAELQRLVRDEGGQIIPFFYNYLEAVSEKVATPDKIGGNLAFDGYRALERWWFK